MLLSKRRLVFTPYQMYFQCLNIHCVESVVPYSDSFDASVSAICDEPSKANRISEDHIRLFPQHGVGTRAMEIYSRLEEFTRRDLSYSSDTLVAFYGIFNAFRRLDVNPVFLTHFWGIPVLGHRDPIFRGQVSETATFAQGLLWSLIDYYPSRSPERQGQWPSWSWTSWTSAGNPVSYLGKKDCHSFYLQEIIQVHVNLLNGSRMDISDFAAGDHDCSDFHPYIDITTWTLRCRLVALIRLKIVQRMDYDDEEDADIILVYLGLADGSEYDTMFSCFLIVKKAEPGVWKRVGLFRSVDMYLEDRIPRPDQLRSLLPNPDPMLGYDWEYKTVRIA
jgi:hypothetical protein